MSSYAVANDTIYVILVLLGAAFLARLRTVIRAPRNRTNQAVCVLLLLLEAAFALGSDTIPAHLPLLSTRPSLAGLVQHCCLVGAGLAGQLLMLWLVGADPRTVPPAIRSRVIVAAVTMSALIALYCSAPIGNVGFDFVSAYGTDPRVCAYLLVFLAYLAILLCGLAWSTNVYSRHARNRSLRFGLRATALSAVVGVGYTVHKAGYTIAVFCHVNLPWSESLVSTSLAGVSVVVLLFGVLLALAGSRLPVLRAWRRRRRDYARIRPLWLTVCDAFPTVALLPPSSSPGGLRRPDADFWIYRFVIEINDALLLLRPYRDDRIPDLVRVKVSGGPSVDVDALIGAANVAAALRAKAAGAEPVADQTALAQPPGTDVTTEVAWMSMVAQHCRRSRVVAAVLAETVQPRYEGQWGRRPDGRRPH